MELTPAQRKKALAGRVAELAGGARLGKGEKSVRKAERNQNSKSVRMGLVSKEKQRSEARLDEVSTQSTQVVVDTLLSSLSLNAIKIRGTNGYMRRPRTWVTTTAH